MTEELEKLNSAQEDLINLMKYIFSIHKSVTKVEVAFSAMIIKKAIDIIDTAKYALKKYNITIQISLLRLLCDNCLAIEAAKEIGLATYVDMVNNGQRVSDIIVDEATEQNMSDGYLKRKVSESYQGFDRLYKFASQGVHFSNQTLASILSYDKDNNIKLNVSVGNKELKEEVINNNERMITLTKIIIRMIKEIILV